MQVRLKRLIVAVLLLQAPFSGKAFAGRQPLELLVTQPYLEMHSGPGRGYPVTYVVGRGETVTVLYSRTEWYKVRAPRGQEGWARRDEVALTTLPSGRAPPIIAGAEFASHRWELGAGYGEYNHQDMITAYADYGITPSIDVEAVVEQALRTPDNALVASLGLRHTFLPEWKWFSPTAGVGAAVRHIVSRNPPPPENDNRLAYVSLGARGFFTERLMWRADWRHYVVFNNTNLYEDLEEWKFGLAVYF
ncbi:MAG: hypothetical protein NVSMB10_16330 [Steroidobacteraceae bacterium]